VSCQNVRYAYAIGDHVRICATEHPGQVTGLLTDSNGPQYRVVWWNNGERKQEWLYEYEVESN
jgi:hypothetical protein